jgi:hypothetical protein
VIPDLLAVIDAIIAIEEAGIASADAMIALIDDTENPRLRRAARRALDDEKAILLTDVPDGCWLEYYLARWEAAALGEPRSRAWWTPSPTPCSTC